MPEVRATLTADSAEYTDAFKHATEAHDVFVGSEHRVVGTLTNIAREMVMAQDPVEALAGSLSHLSHLFEGEFALGMAGGIAVLATVGYRMVEVHEQAVTLREDIEALNQVWKYGPSMDLSTASSGLITSKAEAAGQQMQQVISKLQDPSLTAMVERTWDRLAYAEQGDFYKYDESMIGSAVQAGQDQQKDYKELAARTDKQTDLTTTAGTHQALGYGEATTIDDQKAQLEYEYQEKIAALKDKQDTAGAAAAQRELEGQEKVLDMQKIHFDRTQEEDKLHVAQEVEITKAREEGYTWSAKTMEILEESRHQAATADINGTPYNGGDVANAQVDAETTINRLAQDHLAAETEIAYIVGPRGERAVAQAQAEVVEIQRQRDLLVDKTEWMAKNLELVKAQQALTDLQNQRADERQQLQASGAYLDIQYGYEKKGQPGEETEQEKVDLATSKLADLEAQLQSPDVKGDPNKQLSVENEMKQLRNQIATPVNQLDFDGTTQLAIGGGRRGTGGDPTLAETKTQTEFLKNIDKGIADLNKTIMSQKPAPSKIQ